MNIEFIEGTFVSGVYKGVGDTETVADSVGEYLIALGRAVRHEPTTLNLAWHDSMLGAQYRDSFVAIDPFSAICKLRRIEGVSGQQLTLNAFLSADVTEENRVLRVDGSVFSLHLFGGVGDDETDNTAAFVAATSEVGALGGTLYVPAGTYQVDGDISLPTGCVMLMDKFATVKIMENNPGIVMKKGSAISGGKLASGDSGYTEALIVVDGDEKFHFQSYLNYIRDVFLQGVDNEGTGILIRAGGSAAQSHVTGFTVRDSIISGFEYGLKIEIVDDAENDAFINSNFFQNVWINQCVYSLHLNGVTSETAGVEFVMNHFEKIYIQAEDDISVTAVYIRAGHNKFDLVVWDWREDTPAIVLHDDSYRNYLDVWTDRYTIQDSGQQNIVNNRFAGINHRGYVASYDATQKNIQHYGMNDNVLANGDLLHSITQVSGPAVSGGGVTNALKSTPESFVSWSSIDSGTPVVLEITFDQTYQYIDAIGVNFRYYENPSALTIELYSTNDSAWIEFFDITDADDLTFTFADLTAHPNGEKFTHAFSKLRLTFSGSSTVSASTVVKLEQIYLHARSSFGNQWLPRGNPTILGTTTLVDLITSGTSQFKKDSLAVDIFSGKIGLLIGADNNAITRTNNALKVARLCYAPYVNAQVPAVIAYGYSDATNNILHVGGGASTAQAATSVKFFTAAAVNTATGTQRMEIQADGDVAIAGGGYNNGHLILGDYHLWVDSTGDLRIKNSAPSSDTDGDIVGAQS